MGYVLVRLLLLGILFVGLPTAGVAWYWIATLPEVSVLAKTNPPATALMMARATQARADGRFLRTRWIWVPLSRMSFHLQRAVVIAEDAAFYPHDGFDWDGIRHAMSRNLEEGKLHRGGSTITQQVAKNLYLSQEKSLARKAQEALLTRALERHLSKERILELYLNVAEWGHGVYGAEAAARHHFGKSAEDLSQEEAAMLAAILPSPLRNDPIQPTHFLMKRQQRILRWMNPRPQQQIGTTDE